MSKLLPNSKRKVLEKPVIPNAEKTAESNKEAEKSAYILRDMQRRLGEIVGLMAFSHSHEYLFLSDLKWAVLPPLGLRQYRLVRDKNKQVVAYISWAWVSEEVEKRLSAGQIKLHPNEWKSGEQAVIMDLLLATNSEAAQNSILSELKEKVFAGKILKVLRWDVTQKRVGAE